MTLQSRLVRVGIAKQASKGSGATDPAFAFGLRDGSILGVDVEQEREDVTLHDGFIAPHVNRTTVVPAADWGTRAYAKSIGLLLLGALGSLNTSGGGAPYTHTITPATALPYFSLFGDHNGVYTKIVDSLVSELEISWDGTEPVEVSAQLIGCALSFPGAFGTPGVDDAKAVYMRPVGGEFKVDAASGTPATAKISAGSVSINNNVEPVILSDDVTPDDVVRGEQEIDVSLTLVPDAVDEWRKVLTGAYNGSTVSQDTIYGSFSTKFVIDTNTDLVLTSPRVAFVAEFPDADPSGGASELVLEGAVALPSSGAAFTATLRNAQSSY